MPTMETDQSEKQLLKVITDANDRAMSGRLERLKYTMKHETDSFDFTPWISDGIL